MDMPLDRRAELLDRIVEALLAGGAADLSLRPLADRVGTSARLLIYHFGSKEALITAALAEVRRRVAASLAERAGLTDPNTLRDLVMMVWDWAAEADNQCCFRLLFEVDGLAMFNRINFSRDDRRADSATWIALIERAASRLPADGALFTAHSTLLLGALSGLLQEFLSTGDEARTRGALVDLVDLIDGGATVARPTEGHRS